MITIKNDEEYKIMKRAGEILALTMNMIEKNIKPTVTAAKLDQVAYDYIINSDAKPAFLGYKGYNYTICASLNNEVIHGFPLKTKVLKDGDIISIDLGCKYKGYYADMAATFPVGEVNSSKLRLIKSTEKALSIGIENAIPGNYIGDIGYSIQENVESDGFSVVKEFVGHGIGLNLHEEPQIPNYGLRKTGPMIKEGMSFAIEPMVNAGKDKVITKSDNWTVITEDGKDSAHFEHTIFIKDGRPEILTKFENKRGN